MREHPKIRIEIVGHTDSSGRSDFNLDLSRWRAETVMNYVISAGADPGRLLARGMGSQSPIASNRTAAGGAKNRRIELSIVR